MKRVGLIVQDLDTEYIQELTEGVQQYCYINGLQLFIFIVRAKNWWNGVFDYQHYATISLATKHNLDGLLLVTNTYCQHYPEEQRSGLVYELKYLPLVSIGVQIPGIPSIITDGKKAFKELLNHLYKKHHKRRFAFMMPPNNTSQDIINRFEIYKEFLQEHNMPFDESKIFYANYIFDDAFKALKYAKISKKNLPFDAIVTTGDDLAYGCIDYLNSVGIKVPEDIIVTGYDNQKRDEISTPTLTSIDQHLFNQGFEAARMVDELMKNPKKEIEICRIDSEPRFRRSCGCKFKNPEKITAKEQGFQYRHRSDLCHFQFFLQEMQNSVSLKEFKSLLIKNLKAFDIEKCVICLYDKPVYFSRTDSFVPPKIAKGFIAYTKDDTYSVLEARETDPSFNLVPYGFTFNQDDTIVVTSLFNTSMQYGYALYTPGEVDPSIYEIIFSSVGIALSSNRRLLLDEPQEKITDLNNIYIETNSYKDILTGVLNKNAFEKYGRDTLKISVETGKNGCIIFSDIDNLKLINDQYGHDAGDQAIIVQANLLRSVFRNTDLMGRIGSDEFAIVAPSMTLDIFKRNKARFDELLADFNLNTPFPFKLSISIGCAKFPESSQDLNILLKDAEKNKQSSKISN